MTTKDNLPPPLHLVEQSLLDSPPKSPSNRVFFCRAIAHVGKATIPDWSDAERKATVGMDGENAEAALVRKAYECLCQAILDNEVRLYRRPVKGGPLAPHHATMFQEEDLPAYIIREGITSEIIRMDIGKSGIECASDYYLFVDRDQLLTKFPAKAPVIAPAGMNPDILSDYMRLALRTAADGYGATFSGEKKEIERALFERAGEYGLGGGALTDPIAKSIATILRNKEAQGGRAGPLRKKSGA